MRSPLAQHPDRYWIMEGLSAPMKGGYKGYHAPGLQVDKSGPPTTFSTRLKENYSRKHPAKVIASTPDLNKKNEKLSPEWHATLLTPSAGQQSASPLANGIFHNDHIEPSEILKICKPVDIEKTPELNTAPSSYLVASVQPSVGAGNLEDSNFPAAQHSSTRSATAPSSSSEATSSSSKATSISSEVSSTSILPNYTTLRIDAKYYISMDLPMPSYYTSKWEGSIKKLLETSISSSLAIRDDGEAALMLEVYMAGITKEVLKPSIWITCCSSRMKKKLKSHLKTLQWLENSGFQYFIRVDKTFGYRTDDSTDIDEQTLIEARLPPISETLCGIPARVNVMPSRVSAKSQIRFTIGGLICLDDDFACLTVGHPFLPLSRKDKSEIESSESEDSDYSSSSLDSITEPDVIRNNYYDQSRMTSPDSSEKLAKSFKLQEDSTPFQTLPHKDIISHFAPGVHPNPRDSASKGAGNLDWAMLRMEASPSLLLPNKFQIPGNDHPTFVDQIVPAHELGKGSVWVAAGSGAREGVLNPTPASIFLRGSFRNVRQIMLDKSLKHGDSGSWVIAQGKLSGFIIAGRDSLPWAYMLLIEEVFEDMVICLSQYQKISLPSREFIETARKKLEERKTYETQDHFVVFKLAGADQVPRGKGMKLEQSDIGEQREQVNEENELESLPRESLRHRQKTPEVSKWSEWSAWAWDGEGHRWCRTRTNSEGENDYDYNYRADDPRTGSKPPPSVPLLWQGTTKNLLLPSKDQCFALTDEQCQKIQDILDPDGIRFQKGWELQYQPELIRLYMTGMSFPQIESTMTPRLTWSYRTYSSRFRDWFFPLNPTQRDNKIIQLYALVSESTTSNPTAAPPPLQSKGVLPIRPLQLPQIRQISTPLSQHFLQTYEQTQQNERNRSAILEFDRDSISTIETISTNSTWLSSSAASIFSHPDYASHRDSIATTNSSVVSLASQYSYHQPKIDPLPPLPPLPQPKPLRPPRHDPHIGLWNGILRVIPCGRDHSGLEALDPFERCSICGFTQWHALMVHARSMDMETFVTAIEVLDRIKKDDYAGNSPVHFLMIAGVEMSYFAQLVQRNDNTNQRIFGTNQNSFGQNPLHVLNPQDLGDDLIYFLEWFKPRRTPPGLLLTQRDIYGRTPLHALLQHPLPRNLFPEILKVFPFFEHQLRSLDTAGQSIVQMMNKASLKLRSESESDYEKIQDGITDIKQILSESVDSDYSKYSFHNIARGDRGTAWAGFFECRICNQINAHTNSYIDQMKCACAHGRDRNAPDDTGLTPAHAIITKERSNSNRGHETPEQTAELFHILIPRDDPTLREALHVLDPEGNSLVHNIAVRGFDEILKYVLELETPARRVAMVNACSKSERESGNERSVLECVFEKLRELNERIYINRYTEDRSIKEFLVAKGNRLTRCKHLLVQAGAVPNPSIKNRWRITA